MTESFFDFRKRVVNPAKSAQPAVPADNTLSVTELTTKIEAALKAQLPASLLVKGELSNVNIHRASGHIYFTLKDARSCVDCVMFKSDAARLKFQPADGMEAIVGGGVRLYVQRGRYQLYATSITPVGAGALELAFRQLQEKLGREGLFDEERKRPLPRFPAHVVIVTSRQAAALHDVLKVLRRFSAVKLSVYPVPVQGEGSAEKIAAAIAHVNRHAERIGLDLLMIVRGGGSLEDLWEFNEEAVARAIVASALPVVTGIGHEVDVSIADLVADYHAHTPTEAAQVITRNWRDAAAVVDIVAVRLRRAVVEIVRDARQRLAAIERHETFRRPTDRVDRLRQRVDDLERSLAGGVAALLARAEKRVLRAEARLRANNPRAMLRLARQRVAAAAERLPRATVARLARDTARVDALARALGALNPRAVLGRGYSITTLNNGKIVRSVTDVKQGDKLKTQLADGEVASRATDARQGELF